MDSIRKSERGDLSRIAEIYVFNNRINYYLIEFAIKELNANNLWALEKNINAIRFYQRHGFSMTSEQQLSMVSERKLEEGTTEYLVKMKRLAKQHQK